MKLFVRCAILSVAALALAGCQTTDGPRKIGSRMSKTVHHKSHNTSWKQGFVNPYMAKAGHEPTRASWVVRPVMRKKKQRRVIRRVTTHRSIRSMAMRLAPAGVNVASLSRMVGKRRSVKISCIPAELRMILNTVAWHFGSKVHIQSGYRSKRHNRRVGGARRSYHMSCQAVDIQVRGVGKYTLARYLKTLPGRGGVGTYCNVSTVHIDVGPRRAWHYGCGNRSLARRRMARYNKKRRHRRR